MKKIALVFLLIAVLLIGVVSFSAFPAEADSTDPIYHCLCGNKVADSAEDEVGHDTKGGCLTGCDGKIHAWQPVTAITTGMAEYVYLADSVELSSYVPFTSAGQVCIDLHGETITCGSGVQAFRVNGANTTLILTDSQSGGTIVGSRYTAGGGIILIQKGTLEMYGGTLDASGNTAAGNGGAVNVNVANATFNMYGGTVIGGTATGKLGGAVYASAGSFNMSGGTITGGKAANGGNVYVTNGTFTMTGGEIKGGESSGNSSVSANGGGNVYLTGTATFKMSGGEISGGTAVLGGGNVFVGSGTALTVTGGEISGGTSTGDESIDYTGGGNVYVYGGTFTLNDNGKLAGGTSSISNDKHGGGSVFVRASGTFNMNGGEMTGGSAGYGGAIYLYNSTLNVNGGEIKGGVAENDGGNVYVYGGTFEMTGGKISGGAAKGTDTNSSTANGGGNVYVNSGAAFTLSGEGVIEEGTASAGGNVYVGGTFTMTGGAVRSGESTTSSNQGGGNVFIKGGGKFALSESGEIDGGTAANNGGSVLVRGTFDMNGGTVSGGQAKSGGNIAIYGTVEVTAGTVKDGQATTNTDAGNVFLVTGTTTVSGGSIEGGFKINDTYSPALTLSGTAKIVGEDVPSLTTYDGANITVNGLQDGADIRVTMISGPNGTTFATTTVEGVEAYISYDGNEKLHPAHKEDGSLVWQAEAQVGSVPYATVADALAAYAAGKSVQLLTNIENAELDLDGATVVIDLNGHNLEAEIKDGTVYGMDSAYGKATFDPSACGTFKVTSGEVAPIANVGNKDAADIYVAVKGEGNAYTFHYVNLKVYSLSLRPNYKNKSGETEPAMYFRTSIETDETARETLLGSGGTYGAGLRKSEDKETPVLGNYKCSTFTFGDAYPFNDDKTNENRKISHWGTLISGILTSEEAEVSVDTPIYCRAYITLGNETVFGNSAQMSLKELVQAVDNQKWTEIQRNELITMYQKWINEMSSWGLTHIEEAAANPEG